MVADAPGIIDKIDEMAVLLQNAETIIGYNGKHFDIPFLERYGIRLRPDAVISDPMLDGAVVYGELRTNDSAPSTYKSTYKWKNLKTMAAFCGYTGSNWHNAAADCIATAYVWRRLQEPDMRERYEQNTQALKEFNDWELGAISESPTPDFEISQAISL